MTTQSFHNTTHESGQVLIDFNAAAATQEDLVIEAYRKQNRPMAWGEVKYCLPADMHEGSIKRAITNLANRGLLEKTRDKITGLYGKPTYRYKLKTA